MMLTKLVIFTRLFQITRVAIERKITTFFKRRVLIILYFSVNLLVQN